MNPPKEKKLRIDHAAGHGTLVFPEGKRVPVECVLEVFQYSCDGTPYNTEITGKVWDSRDPYLSRRYLGKSCVLEISGRRLGALIMDLEGTIGHAAHGVVEGFPGMPDARA